MTGCSEAAARHPAILAGVTDVTRLLRRPLHLAAPTNGVGQRLRFRRKISLAAFEAGCAEVLAWVRAASVPSAGIALQQTDIPFCRRQLAIARSCALAPDKRINDRWRQVMKTRFTVALSLLAGVALGAAAVQGLHAQAKPKAYIISETEVLDAAADELHG